MASAQAATAPVLTLAADADPFSPASIRAMARAEGGRWAREGATEAERQEVIRLVRRGVPPSRCVQCAWAGWITPHGLLDRCTEGQAEIYLGAFGAGAIEATLIRTEAALRELRLHAKDCDARGDVARGDVLRVKACRLLAGVQ